jgi:hypothetical protein
LPGCLSRRKMLWGGRCGDLAAEGGAMGSVGRQVTISSLDEVMPDVDRLLRGHTTIGNWSLGQICSHLAQAMNFTIDGFPREAFPPWIIRKTLGRLLLWHSLRTGRFTEGLTMPKKYEPTPGTDARVEAESLRATIRRFAAHSGPLAEHPMKGAVSRAVWERFHCIHCAHHLGFALPAGQEGKSDPSG